MIRPAVLNNPALLLDKEISPCNAPREEINETELEDKERLSLIDCDADEGSSENSEASPIFFCSARAGSFSSLFNEESIFINNCSTSLTSFSPIGSLELPIGQPSKGRMILCLNTRPIARLDVKTF